MKMSRIGDPRSEALIQFVIDGDRIGGIRLVVCSGQNTALDPIMNDPKADAVSFANLPNV